MAKTSTQLANRALGKLFLVGIGHSAAAEDTAKVLESYTSFKAFLEEADIYTIADDDDIPEAAFEFLGDILAWFVAPDFHKPRASETPPPAAEYNLRRITSSRPTGEVLRAEYF